MFTSKQATAFIVFSLLALYLHCGSAEFSGNWVLADSAGQNIVQHFLSDSSRIVLRLSLSGRPLQKTLHKVQGVFPEDSRIIVMHGADANSTFPGTSIAMDIYKDENDTSVITVAERDLDGLVVIDGFAWHLRARSGMQLEVESDGNVEGLCAGDEAKELKPRRLAVQRWTDCYTGDSVTRRFSIGVAIASGLFERRFDNDHIQATEWVSTIVAEANLIYKQQLNIVLTVGELIIQHGSQNAPSWDDPSCRISLSEQLDRFRSWEQPSKQGLWHLLDDCWGTSGTSIGLATMLVSDAPGTLCMMERVRGYNEFWNTAVSWYSTRTWKTFAHEVGHNFGAHHSFEEGQQSTGGIMDYGDGKLNGEYQFNSKYRKEEICRSIQKVIGTCSAFSEFDDDGQATTAPLSTTPSASTTLSATDQPPDSTTKSSADCENCQDVLVPGGSVTMTFNGITYNDCTSLIAATNGIIVNFWCTQFEPSFQLCKFSCGACSADCTTISTTPFTTTPATSQSMPPGTTSTTNVMPSSTTHTDSGQVGIQSGDTIFLKTRSGSGAHVDVDGIAVQARWTSRGQWQALVIEKASAGIIASGDRVFLRTHVNTYIDIQDDDVQARWDDKGDWQSLAIEKKNGTGPILPHDLVCFKAHTGKHLDVQDGVVRARWDDCGDWQAMLLEKEVVGAVFSGTTVTLAAHTGRNIDIEGQSVQARWSEYGQWQSIVIESPGGRALFSGDQVFLKAHTGKLLDVEGVSVQARWHDYGTWQSFTIEKEVSGAIMPNDVVFLRAHTGKVLDVQGDSVGAHWDDHGSWQALVIKKFEPRRLSNLRGSSPAVGAAGLVAAVSSAVALSVLLVNVIITRYRQSGRAALILESACSAQPREGRAELVYDVNGEHRQHYHHTSGAVREHSRPARRHRTTPANGLPGDEMIIE